MPQLMNLYESILRDQLTAEQTQNARMARQLNEQKLIEQQQELAQQKQRQNLLQQLFSDSPTTEEQIINDTQSRIQNSQNMVDKLQNASKKIMSADPEVGIKWGTEATKIQQEVFKTQKEQSDVQLGILKHIAGWTGTIKDQQTLDNAYQQVEERHPGLWDDMKLPHSYSTISAPIFSQVAAAASTALQQKDLELKTIELKHANEVQELKKEELRSKVMLNRERTIAVREGLDKKQDSPNSQIKKLEADEYKLTQAYTQAVAKAEAEVLKAYPTWMEEPKKYWWTDESKSPKFRREQDLKAKKEAINRQYQQNFDALNRRRAELGLSAVQLPTDLAPNKPIYKEGQIYQDANGNKARYVNGQWEQL